MGLGQAIISKFPISSHHFDFFYNPKFELIDPNGEKWISHNKGITSCEILINDNPILVSTLHLIPFRKFGIPLDDPRIEKVKKSIAKNINVTVEKLLLQGDFNVDNPSLKEFLPEITSKTQEVLLDTPTTPKNRRYDHVVYKGLKHLKSEVITTLTDHYIVYSEFEL
jgi:endonuclease/exonuclease/phosphatase (EEP) superfamily protein YafD